jgi:hypothetical protein
MFSFIMVLLSLGNQESRARRDMTVLRFYRIREALKKGLKSLVQGQKGIMQGQGTL